MDEFDWLMVKSKFSSLTFYGRSIRVKKNDKTEKFRLKSETFNNFLKISTERTHIVDFSPY